ncbi:SNF2-related protein [Arthrobacter sp. LAPM80]|uniref:SNF2-related protein n=1 Tax=Arthrobacter sp. LAPM80 TaxID=3141788 RepID=UPI00398B0C99
MSKAATAVAREEFGIVPPAQIDTQRAAGLLENVLDDFRQQLSRGIPSESTEVAVRHLANQIASRLVSVKLFLEHQLHAKLYLCHLNATQQISRKAYLGSSNLTFSGLSGNGELNVDVTDDDATAKLMAWFQDRWSEPFCYEIDSEIIQVINESWASGTREPYLVYLKMAYHLSEDARAGVTEYHPPVSMQEILLPFQTEAISIAARHLRRRNGVLIGDVVGLGKTLVGTALALLCQEQFRERTLVISPLSLVSNWKSHFNRYGLDGEVMSLSRVIKDLSDVAWEDFQVVLIDESHNLRNRDGKAYAVIKQFIHDSGAKCILLSATPYNKSFADLGSQLRLFLHEDTDLGIQPEALRRSMENDADFLSRVENPTSLRAFEESSFPEDWQQLMRQFMIRRTKSFIEANYTEQDENGRRFISFTDGRRSYFPKTLPRTIEYGILPGDPLEKLYSQSVVDDLNQLKLPRYAIGRHLDVDACQSKRDFELYKAFERANAFTLAGLIRTSLFKRLESSLYSFEISLRRHLRKNRVFQYALEHGFDIPAGSYQEVLQEQDEDESDTMVGSDRGVDVEYRQLKGRKSSTVTWIPARLLKPGLADVLETDCKILENLLLELDPWSPETDSKAAKLVDLLRGQYDGRKVLVFTEFADTARYLGDHLVSAGIEAVSVITGGDVDPLETVRRFSPVSNEADILEENQIRVLIATDVLSEGQNLQDAAIVLQYDLPWAIIKLVQRAGRVDRIGQQATEIEIGSFIPPAGLEQVLNLRARLQERLRQNGEVVGSDDQFFDVDASDLAGLYDATQVSADTAVAATLDDVDVGSFALQVWRDAIEADPTVEGRVRGLPNLVTASRSVSHDPLAEEGVLSFLRTRSGIDSLVWVGVDKAVASRSPLQILRLAACPPDTSVSPRDRRHFALLDLAAEEVMRTVGHSLGTAGNLSGTRKKLWEMLNPLHLAIEGFDQAKVAVFEHPLRERAKIDIGRRFREKTTPVAMAEFVSALHLDDELSAVLKAQPDQDDLRILCSMGIFRNIETVNSKDTAE